MIADFYSNVEVINKTTQSSLQADLAPAGSRFETGKPPLTPPTPPRLMGPRRAASCDRLSRVCHQSCQTVVLSEFEDPMVLTDKDINVKSFDTSLRAPPGPGDVCAARARRLRPFSVLGSRVLAGLTPSGSCSPGVESAKRTGNSLGVSTRRVSVCAFHFVKLP